ncbi:MAG TPA: nucleoside-diphosphate sugar epimerase/dehydratase [Bryobacteraceae bacterium]|jgi:FlaA1/EpsC-like NDP-sugar epimerase
MNPTQSLPNLRLSPTRIQLEARRIASTTAQLERWLAPYIHLLLFAASGGIAFLLRFDFTVPAAERTYFVTSLCVWAVVKSIVFALLGLNRGWRDLSMHALARLTAANLLGSAVGAVAILYLATPGFPRSIYLLDLLICCLLTGGLRVSSRIASDLVKGGTRLETPKRALIYGAGDAGELLLREIQQNPALPYDVAGFIDDDKRKRGLFIRGTRVAGDGSQLNSLVKRLGVEVVLIAIPSASGAQMTRILQACHAAGASYKTVPSMGEVLEDTGLARQIRDVAVEDLLGRSPVRLDQDRIRGRLENRVVLVTGAAGSIGSELCRQIARFRPQAIVGFEIAETALFHLEREMAARFPSVPFHGEIGSVQNPARLAEIFRKYRPSVVYHAAAYKHVPLMESHPFEAIENNVLGAYRVAAAAAESGSRHFVMISSDKAVRPTNIMGATKRLAELVILSLQNRRTKYVAVRFGNVLGSNGSVIPIFKQQIAEGGPVTVTHPEMRRYFMTIPEASQLVLQSSIMGNGGEIFVLDMGDPVKIQDLARKLILLSGLRPDADIKIDYTGLRPGEKLFEELSMFDEHTLPTGHEKIKVFAGNSVSEAQMRDYLSALEGLCKMRDLRGTILHLKEIVPEYNPSGFILRQLLSDEATRPQLVPPEPALAPARV